MLFIPSAMEKAYPLAEAAANEKCKALVITISTEGKKNGLSLLLLEKKRLTK